MKGKIMTNRAKIRKIDSEIGLIDEKVLQLAKKRDDLTNKKTEVENLEIVCLLSALSEVGHHKVYFCVPPSPKYLPCD